MKLLSWAALTLAAMALLALAGLGVALLLDPQMAADLAKRPVAAKAIGGGADAAPADPAARLIFSKRLAEAGAKTCLALIDALGKGVSGGVANLWPASNWSKDAPDQHLASVWLGQKFDTPKLPFGFAGLIGAPNRNGGCDGVSLQVLPSPLDCAKLREDLLKRGKLLGDLTGVTLIQDVASQVALVPTGANTCVMVSMHTVDNAKP